MVVASLLVWTLLGVEHITLRAAEGGLTLTLRTDKATYQVGSQATVTLIFRSTTPMSGETGVEGLGCNFDIVILDAGGAEVFRGSEGVFCIQIVQARNVPPAIVKQAIIPLQNNLQGDEPLAPGLYTVRGTLFWSRTIVADGIPRGAVGRPTAEMVIEITQ
jgi:hypothetical protein